MRVNWKFSFFSHYQNCIVLPNLTDMLLKNTRGLCERYYSLTKDIKNYCVGIHLLRPDTRSAVYTPRQDFKLRHVVDVKTRD